MMMKFFSSVFAVFLASASAFADCDPQKFQRVVFEYPRAGQGGQVISLSAEALTNPVNIAPGYEEYMDDLAPQILERGYAGRQSSYFRIFWAETGEVCLDSDELGQRISLAPQSMQASTESPGKGQVGKGQVIVNAAVSTGLAFIPATGAWQIGAYTLPYLARPLISFFAGIGGGSDTEEQTALPDGRAFRSYSQATDNRRVHKFQR